MKLKKIVATAIALALVVGGSTTNVAFATEPKNQILISNNNHIIVPLWDSISDISPYISVDGNTLYPEVYIEAKGTTGSISGTMHLEKYSSGKWTSVTSWSFKGTSNVFLSKSYTGSSGVKYRTRVVVNVNGETAEVTSGSCEV